MTPTQRKTMEQALDGLIEGARLLGTTQAKKGFDSYSQEDAVLERAWHESIAKHSAAIRAVLAEQPAEQEPITKETYLQELLAFMNANDPSRWEIGFRNIVSILLGPKSSFEIADVVEMVRQLKQPVDQEPVAWLHPANATCVTTDPTAYARGIPLYKAPQPRQANRD